MPGNWYRLNRVLEILVSSGRPLGELNLDVDAPLDYDFRCFFLNRSRLELYRRIDARVEAMVCGGLLQVNTSLLQRPSAQLPATASCEGHHVARRCAAHMAGDHQGLHCVRPAYG